MEKITNRKALDYVVANCELPGDVKSKLEAMIVSLDKKATANRKPTKAQEANEAVKDEIVEKMETNHLYTITELMKMLDGEYSNQKVSALVRQLIAEGKVVRTEEKGKAFFSLA